MTGEHHSFLLSHTSSPQKGRDKVQWKERFFFSLLSTSLGRSFSQHIFCHRLFVFHSVPKGQEKEDDSLFPFTLSFLV